MAQWLDNAVFYEIYPQSFKDTNSDGIGDFNGIIEKLDYISELGCNCIWMNPCFESPFSDAGYDVADYYKAAPRYGTNDDLKRLFEEVHKRNMHILLDLVPGHTSVQHQWFLESMKAGKNEYTDRYVWSDSVWEAVEGMGFLRGISERSGSCVINFFSCQPALNYGFYKPERPWQQPMDAPGPRATIAELKNIMRFWLGLGCDGFRVDMAGSLVKKDEDSKGTIQIWQEIRAFLDKEFPEAAIISEWGDPDKSLEGGFHMDFLLPFGAFHFNDLFRCEEPYFSGRGNGDIAAFAENYKELFERNSRKGLICIPSGNHDTVRLAKYLQGDELKIAFAFLLSMPGAPFLYYGDEIGMRYVENLTSVEGGYERTGSRSPMQWDGTPNAGFSCAPAEDMYIPLDSSPERPTVQAQMADSGSLYHDVKALIALRQSHPALQSKGDIEFLYAESHSYPFAYLRSMADEKILVLLNPSGKSASFDCTLPLSEKLHSFGGKITAENGKINVPAGSFGFYRV